MIQMYQNIPPLLIYLLVATCLLLESTGIPALNTTILLFTGAMVAQGGLNPGLLMFAALTGSTLGACCAYGLGRRYGENLLLRLARVLRINTQKVQLAERWFQRAGGRMIFFSRILPYIRPLACFPAGISHMPFPRFLLASTSGSLLWCATLLVVGWELGPRWRMALHLMRTYTLPTLFVLLFLLVVYFFVRYALKRYMKKRLSAEEETSVRNSDLLEV